MNREEAYRLVYPYIINVGPYSVVEYVNALSLLGKDRFANLVKDPIKGIGPTKDTLYSWNVIDAMYQSTQCP